MTQKLNLTSKKTIDSIHKRLRCKCIPGFEGVNCTRNIDDCVENKCENGAICLVSFTWIQRLLKYLCEFLLFLWTNESKENVFLFNGNWILFLCVLLLIDFCVFSHTQFMWKLENGNREPSLTFILQDAVDGYSCQCLVGYTGKHCEIQLMSYSVYQSTAACEAASCQHVSL